MLSEALTEAYWEITWPFLLVLGLFFLGFNLFYLRNRRLFKLLEMENWPALTRYLEGRVIKKGRYSPRLVRLLANTYLLLSDAAAVMGLENKVALAKPKLINDNVLIFGTARILGGDISGAVRFFGTRRESKKAGSNEWIDWYYAFSLLLNHQYEESGKEFTFFVENSKDNVLIGLSSYFLAGNIAYLLPNAKRKLMKTASEGKEKVHKYLTATEWSAKTYRLSSEIHVAAIAKYLDETSRWLYS